MRVLFVCTGNICRSPMAERLAELHATELRIKDFHAVSAGVRAVRGHPIHEHAALVLGRLGACSESFIARQLTPRIAIDCDLVVTMTRQHREQVLELAPSRLKSCFTLAEVAYLVTEHGARSASQLDGLRPKLAGIMLADVVDPIGQDAEFFWRVGTQVDSMVRALVTVTD